MAAARIHDYATARSAFETYLSLTTPDAADHLALADLKAGKTSFDVGKASPEPSRGLFATFGSYRILDHNVQCPIVTVHLEKYVGGLERIAQSVLHRVFEERLKKHGWHLDI